MTETELDLEEAKRKRCVVSVRDGDMGEGVSNILMEQINDNETFLDVPPQSSITKNGNLFTVKRRGNNYETRIGSIEISEILAMRLQALFTQNNPYILLTQSYLDNFLRRVFLLIYRYQYVDPGFRRQGFLAPRYFFGIADAFEKPINLEGFASAINATVPKYCSLFYDVEKYFGSIGSFFNLKDLGENYLIQVSPPRIGKITTQAVKHCINLIKKIKDKSSVYHIILFTPAAWVDVSKIIDSSEFLVWSYNPVKREKMGYLDVTLNEPSLYPMPRISVLSNSPNKYFSEKLYKLFSES